MTSREVMPQRLWLVCFKYAPGNWQHMESFAIRAEESGLAVRHVLSKRFRWMVDASSYRVSYATRSDTFVSIVIDTFLFLAYRWIGLARLLRRERPSVVILVMWHPLNVVFCLMARFIASSRVVVWLHEPYKENKSVYGAKAVVFYFVECLQSLAMPWTDDVVVHSELAFQAFRRRYPKAKQDVHVIPLQFRDAPGEKCEQRRIAFLGKAAKAKGINAFLDLVGESTERELDWEFVIATPDPIEPYLAVLTPEARRTVEVIHNPNLSDVELRAVASSSVAVVCLYSASMQSGVVPLAFMCGAPVVATDIPALAYAVSHKRTGYLISTPVTSEAVLEGLTYIAENLSTLSANCRQEFLDVYDDGNWLRAYGWLCPEVADTECSVSMEE
jgi:glycosyltransferase involved in cell wall biosynthesis